MSRVTVCGKEIRYHFINEEYQDGSSPILVFLHDGLGSIGTWKDVPEVLSEQVDLTALVYDRYGHGGSQHLEEPRDRNYMNKEALEFLPDLLEKLEISENVILVGHSDGGSIALLYAAAFPERTQGVITEAAHVFVEEVTIQGIEETVQEFRRGKLKNLLEKYHDVNTDGVFYGWSDIWLSPNFRTWNIEKHLSRINSPILAIQGYEDQYGTYKQVESIVDGVRGEAEPFMVPACGHIPHHEARNSVLAKMEEFIQERLPKK